MTSASSVFASAMPKVETGALSFIEEHPEYDGRGTVVAILDTGVDPGAAGLQLTSHGLPKIIDVLDGTGSGDVDTSKVVQADADGCILSLTDTKLQVNPEWDNPSGDWHVGLKSVFELYPSGLKRRIQGRRSEAALVPQRKAVTAAGSALAAFDAKHTAAPKDSALVKERKELEARVALLKQLQEKRDDCGPLLHCVVWHDGEHWRAALDTTDLFPADSDEGRLRDFTPLTDFRTERQYGTFSALDACNFVCNVYDDGNVLSIVTDSGAHGTHVAGITAACHPEDPDLNGVAPGAQLISCKIGDSRLGGMETGVGLTRAIIDVLTHRCDLINMSFGEPTTTPNQGHFIRLANEAVHKHGVIFVSSAGNSGPALSTVGAPGGTSSSIYSIGAFVSPALAAAGHSHDGPLPELGRQYNWSSRGPTPDGHLGVTFSAPGGAIAPVPQWSRDRRMLMNGTSMASPNAAGCVALLLSALKAQGQAFTPASVRQAIAATAAPVDDPPAPDSAITYGAGLVQVPAAYAHLQRAAEEGVAANAYDVTVRRADGGPPARGIYLRNPADFRQRGVLRFTATVAPKLHEDADVREECLAVEEKLTLKSSADWVTCPAHLLLMHGGRTLDVAVDATGLDPGLHTATVTAYDVDRCWRGALFELPVTVCVPEEALADPVAEGKTGRPWSLSLEAPPFEPGSEWRTFVAVPEGASWAEVHLTMGSAPQPATFMIHASQLLPGTRPTDTQSRAVKQLAQGVSHCSTFTVAGGAGLELTIAQFWRTVGACRLRDVRVEFHGFEAAPSALHLPPGDAFARLAVRAPLRQERLSPAASFTGVSWAVRPSADTLAPLPGARDLLPDGRAMHALTLTYKFTLAEGGVVTPTLPALNSYVYDAEIESHFHFLQDAHGALEGAGDTYPDKASLPAGEHVLRVRLRHEDASLLGSLRSMPAALHRALEPPVSLPVYPSMRAALTGGKPCKDAVLVPGGGATLFVGPLPEEAKLPKDATPGVTLRGTLSLGKASAQHGTGECPQKVPLSLTLPPAKAAAPAEGGDEAQERDAATKVAEAVRDAKLKCLKGMDAGDKDAEAYRALLSEVQTDFPEHLPAFLEPLERWAKLKGDKRATALRQGVDAADGVIQRVDRPALAAFLGSKHNGEGPEAKQLKKDMDAAQEALITALSHKAMALMELEEAAAGEAAPAAEPPAPVGEAGTPDTEPERTEDEPVAAAETPTVAAEDVASGDVDEVFQELRKWADTEAKHAVLHAKVEARAGRLAGAVQVLDKLLAAEDKPADKEAMQLKRDLLRQLGWEHWADEVQARITRAFPPVAPLF